MSFFITARTILHLGSDLISSDAVAIYELIKNAIDAGSETGVDVQFDIVIRQSDFAAAMSLLKDDESVELDDAKAAFVERVDAESDTSLKDRFITAIRGARSKEALAKAAQAAYRDCNQIVVSDTGHGMTRRDLSEIYLTIGTTHRAKAVRSALSTGTGQSPYLGEKGAAFARGPRCVY